MRLFSWIGAALSALLVLPAGVLGAQETAGAPLPEPVLRSSDHDAIGRALQRLMEARIEHVELVQDTRRGNPRAVERSNQRVQDLRTQFWEECDRRARQNRVDTVLRNVADLKAIFAHAFRYGSQHTGSSVVQRPAEVHGNTLQWGLWAPRSYNPRQTMPLLVSLPPRTSDGSRYEDSRRHLDVLWRGHEFQNKSLMVAPAFPGDRIPLDEPVDLSDAAQSAAEDERIAWFFRPLARVIQDYNVDSDRVALEASKESAPFALRIATYFPDRFSAIVLRDPVDLGAVHPESLRRIPILILSGPPSRAHATAFVEKMQALGMGNHELLEVEGDFPYQDHNGDVAEWIEGHARDLFNPRLTIVPTNRRFLRAYWAQINACDPIDPAAPADQRPRLELVADREQNRITATAKGVESFSLFLNDLLIDMDREFTVFINGAPRFSGMLERNGDQLINWVFQRSDNNWIFLRQMDLTVVREEEATAAGEEAAEPPGGPGR